MHFLQSQCWNFYQYFIELHSHGSNVLEQQLVSFRVEYRLPMPEHRNQQQYIYIYIWVTERVDRQLNRHIIHQYQVTVNQASSGVGQLVTSDESPILFGRKGLCTTTLEYDPYVSKGKTTVSIRFIIKIHKIFINYRCGCRQIQNALQKFRYLKKHGICEEFTPNRPN